MSALQKRLERLEARRGKADYLPAWRAAAARGLYLDFATGQPVTLEKLRTIDPVRYARIVEVQQAEALQTP